MPWVQLAPIRADASMPGPAPARPCGLALLDLGHPTTELMESISFADGVAPPGT
jgi:hypothetical protein